MKLVSGSFFLSVKQVAGVPGVSPGLWSDAMLHCRILSGTKCAKYFFIFGNIEMVEAVCTFCLMQVSLFSCKLFSEILLQKTDSEIGILNKMTQEEMCLFSY